MRALVIGTGVGLRTHLPSLIETLGPARIGVVSRDPSRARKLVHQPLGYFGSDLRTALQEWHPDLLTVGVPTNLHVRIAAELATYQGAILMEKPVGLNYEECERISTALSRNRVFINFQLRGLPLFQQVRELVQHGGLGSVYFIGIHERSDAFFTATADAWYFHPQQGGGQRLAMLTHLIDLVQFMLTSTVTSESAHNIMILPEPRSDPEHTSSCTFQLGCSSVQLTSSAAALGPRSVRVEIVGSEGRIEFGFTDGSGTCFLFTGSHRNCLWEHTGDELSLFRIAFPYYLASVLQAVEVGAAAADFHLATFREALAVHGVLALSSSRPDRLTRAL